MISIVLVGRNDNYGGNFESRTFSTLSHNVLKLEERGIDYEIIFVEWNPVFGQPLLSNKINAKFEKSTCYVVGNSIHRHIGRNKHIKVYEYHGKNVGAKHAKGDWLLITNPDVFFGKEVIDFLASEKFDAKTLYRAGWINIKNESDVDNTNLKDQTKDDQSPFTRASGDFVFIKKDLFDLVGGYREDLAFTNTHKDSIFCLTVFDQTHQTSKIGNIYHLDHKRDNNKKRRVGYNLFKVPRTHQEKYGHEDISNLKKISKRVYKLSLKKRLMLKGIVKTLPNPKALFKF
jgi:hypothetical protein